VIFIKKIIDKEELINARARALRKRIWYTAISKVERGIINLTLKCIKKVTSNRLILILNKIVTKIKRFLKHSNKIEQEGFLKANINIKIACSWGNVKAKKWIEDSSFRICVGLNSLSSHWNKIT
jgi:hypothetical protein